MTSHRIVTGSIARMVCKRCRATFPHFVFEGETDTDTAGLVSASACGLNRIVLIGVDAQEWNDLVSGEVVDIERRIA